MKLAIVAICLFVSLAAAAPSAGNLQSDDPCQLCQGAVQKLKEYKDKVHDQVQSALGKACGIMGPMKEACQRIVQHATQTIDQALDNPQATCQKVQLCSGAAAPTPQSMFVKPAVAANVDSCELCKGAMEKLKEFRAKVVDKVHAAMKKACKAMGDQMEESCNRIVDHVSETVQQALDHPEETCQKVHLCHQNSGARVANEMLKFPDVCEMCQEAVATVADVVLSAVPQVEQVVYQVCSHLGSMEQECYGVVDEVAQKIEQVLANPQETCYEFQLCSDESAGQHNGTNAVRMEKLHKFIQAKRMNMMFGGNYLCMACNMASNAFSMECHQPAFQQSVANLLTPICQLKPGSEDEKNKCKDYIAQSLPNLLEKYICASVAPQFCKAVNWC